MTSALRVKAVIQTKSQSKLHASSQYCHQLERPLKDLTTSDVVI